MALGNSDAAAHLEPPANSSARSRNARRWWSVVTSLIVAMLFLQAVFAGAMLSGIGWARPAHKMTAAILIASTLLCAIASTILLGRVAHGAKLSLALFGLAALEFLQMAAGSAAARGANLMWLHIPLGVALVGLAGLAAGIARELGPET